jgi:cell shape-determining protein MreC
MSALRFNQVFFGLMLAAFVCAFVVPQRLIDPARLNAAGLFNPLSYPIRQMARAVDRGTVHVDAVDPLAQENYQLRQEVAILQAKVAELQKLEGERQNLGDLSSQCVRATVAGADSAGRDALILSVPRGTHLGQDEPVVYPGGIVGRLEASHGWVRLITDKGFAFTGAFLDAHGARISAPAPLLKGLGNGQLGIVGMRFADCAGLARGDWVVLDDPQWPAAVQRRPVGRIVSIGRLRSATLFADIHVAPQADLTQLGEVWVLNTD